MTGNVREHNVVGLDMSVQDAIEMARRVLIAQGFQNIAAGPTAATFVRDYREPRMTLLAYGLAIPTLGLSLFALTSRAQEHCTVAGHESSRGTRLSITGTSSFETMTDIEAGVRAGAGPQLPGADPDSGYNPFPLLGMGRPDAPPPVAATPSRRAPDEDAQPSWRNAPANDDAQPSWRNAPADEDSGPSWRNPAPEPEPFPAPTPFPSPAAASSRRPATPEPDSGPAWRPVAAESEGFPAPAVNRRPSAPDAGPAWRPVSASDTEQPFPVSTPPRRAPSPDPDPFPNSAAPRRSSASDPFAAPAAASPRRSAAPDPFPEPASPFPDPAAPPFKAAAAPFKAAYSEPAAWPEPDPDPDVFPEAPPPFSGPPPTLAPSPFPSGPLPATPKRAAAPPAAPPSANPSSGQARSRRSMPVPVPDPAASETMLWPSPGAFASTPEGVAEPAEARWLLTIDDGRTIEAKDFGLIGRDPELAEGDPDGELVPMVDPEMSVSKTHAAFGVDDDGLWFLDRHSTNGTATVGPGGERVALEPGVPMTIAPGSEVWIGRRHLKVDLESDG